MKEALIFFFIFFGIPVIPLVIIIPLSIIHKRYKDFVLLHSLAIKELRQINSHYRFNSIREYDQVHSYDNANFYETISAEDYLIYQLVYIQKEVIKALNDTIGNRIFFEDYKKEIAEKCHLNTFDSDDLPKNRNRLIGIEKKLFQNRFKFCP